MLSPSLNSSPGKRATAAAAMMVFCIVEAFIPNISIKKSTIVFMMLVRWPFVKFRCFSKNSQASKIWKKLTSVLFTTSAQIINWLYRWCEYFGIFHGSAFIFNNQSKVTFMKSLDDVHEFIDWNRSLLVVGLSFNCSYPPCNSNKLTNIYRFSLKFIWKYKKFTYLNYLRITVLYYVTNIL